jgi:hypothetical protein
MKPGDFSSIRKMVLTAHLLQSFRGKEKHQPALGPKRRYGLWRENMLWRQETSITDLSARPNA